MKIRIKDNSIRLRLTQSEVNQLGEIGIVKCTTEFVNHPFIYEIESAEIADLSAEFIENRILVRMPENLVDKWVSTDKVGYAGQSGLVKILVEKDFVCIDNTDEDQTDNFPNPNIKC